MQYSGNSFLPGSIYHPTIRFVVFIRDRLLGWGLSHHAPQQDSLGGATEQLGPVTRLLLPAVAALSGMVVAGKGVMERIGSLPNQSSLRVDQVSILGSQVSIREHMLWRI